MSVQWTVGEAEMRRVRQPKRAVRALQASNATIEVAEPLRGEESMTASGGNLIDSEVKL